MVDTRNPWHWGRRNPHYAGPSRAQHVTDLSSSAVNALDDFASPEAVGDLGDADRVRKLQADLLESGDAHLAYRVAVNVPGADIEWCQSLVIDSGDVDLIAAFASDVQGANKRACRKAIDEINARTD